MFEPKIVGYKICFKCFSKEGIKFKFYFSVKNNFIFALTLNSLFGDLFIVNRKIKIGSNEKIGECFCNNSVKLEYNKMNLVKLTLIIYWKAIFFVIIPNLFFYSQYKAVISVINNYVKEVKINVYCNFRITMLFNLIYEIYINVSGKALCIPFNKPIIEKIDNINIFKEFFKSIKNKFKAYSL